MQKKVLSQFEIVVRLKKNISMYSEKDLAQIKNKGISIALIEEQIANFKNGFPFVKLDAPATLKYGMKKFDAQTTNELADFYLRNLNNIRTLKFVPASGAATRMFSHLFSFRSEYVATDEQIEQLKGETDFNTVGYFFKNIQLFAFFNDLKTCMSEKGKDITTCLEQHDYNTILDFLLYEPGLNYAALPKALLKFHNYETHPRTAVEEHLVEGANYCSDSNRNVDIHFTLSPEHIGKFETLLKEVVAQYEESFKVKFRITHSIQNASTDTIAVDEDNLPFRNADGSLLFRPGGHGALINNLNHIVADIVFIKNIDNIVPDRLKPETNLYKMALAGCLLNIRNSVYEYLKLLEKPDLSEKILNQIISFIKDELMCTFAEDFFTADKSEKIRQLFALLNRPIRVCGMVKNEGEPGGGPIVVRDCNGNLSLQIIESSQVDVQDESQRKIMSKATHFNPVDLVCCFMDYKGRKFNLNDFVDVSTGFISLKTKDGKPLKAQELPGLWNGAMAKWHTIFVEVPIITFNPVKTVNDLLRKEHL